MTYEEALAVATANNEIDENQTFLIDKNLRTVTIPDGFVLGVFNDKNVQIVPFAMPRYYNGIDMSTFAIQVNYVNSAGDGDIYLVFDQDVQEDLILFNWVVDRTAFATSGKTGFVVCMKEDDEYGYVAREFNTTLAYAPVLEGLEIDNPIDEQTALDILTQIQRAAERADIAAQQAEDSAAQASTDANTASDAASSATSSAATATAAQTSASASATTATNAETNALAYRDAAAASAAEAAAVVSGIDDVLSFPNALVVESATSEDIVTIEDGADDVPMKSLVAEITPVQDLNGQANPYPAGGGDNLFPPLTSGTRNGVTITVADNGTVTVNGTATTDTYFDVDFSASLTSGTPYYICGFNPSTSTSRMTIFVIGTNGNIQVNLNTANAIYSGTASADSTFSRWRFRIPSGETYTNFVVRPMFKIGGTAPTAYSPYENICPISGRTGMTVTRAGKNLLNQETVVLASENSWATNKSFPSPILPGEYVFSVLASVTGGVTFGVRDIDGNSVGSASFAVTAGKRAQVRITISGVGVTYGGYYNRGGTLSEFQLEAGTSVTAYEPYVGQTYPITWETEAGTVYGGTLDVVSGVLTVTHVFVSLFGIQYYWQKSGTYNGSFYISAANFANEYNVPPIKTFAPFVCSHAKTVERAADYQFGGCYMDSSLSLWLLPADSTVDDFRNYLNAQATAGTPVQVCCQLATPQTYQLTPTEVRTLLGVNNLWSDGDSMTAKYRADLKLYIDKKIAEAIA